jgi:hypothetical protein
MHDNTGKHYTQISSGNIVLSVIFSRVHISINISNLMFAQCLVLAVLTRKVQESSHVSAVVSYRLTDFRNEQFKQKNTNGILQTVTDELFVKVYWPCVFTVRYALPILSSIYVLLIQPSTTWSSIFLPKRSSHNAINISSRLCLPNPKLSYTLSTVHSQRSAFFDP